MSIPLAPAEDQPTISSGSLPAATLHSTIIGSNSVGYMREKRVGVAESAPGVSQSSSAALDVDGSSHYRYPGMLSRFTVPFSANPGNYISTTYKPGNSSSVQSAFYQFAVEFTTSAPQVSIRTNATSDNARIGRVYVNGLLTTTTIQNFSATAGNGTEVVLTFPSAKERIIKIVGFNQDQGRFGGVDVPAGYTVTKPTDPMGPVWIFLGDSYVNGAGSNATSGANDCETWIWELAALAGANNVVSDGVGGTGFVTDTGGLTNRFATRVPDITDLLSAGMCDVLVIAGGRNDTSNSIASALQDILDSTIDVPTRYIATTTSDSQSTVLNDLQTVAASNDVPYITPFSIDALPKISDGIHMTQAGHATYAEQAFAAIPASGIKNLRLGGSTPDDVRLGSSEVAAIYLGSSKVWE